MESIATVTTLTPVPKPDRAAFEKEETKLKNEIEALKTKREKLNAKIENHRLTDAAGKNKYQDVKQVFNDLLTAQKRIKEERAALIAERDAARAIADKLSEEAKVQKSKVKFGSLDDIQRKIDNLETRMHSGNMNLREEKETIREIELLGQQKRQLSATADVVARAEKARDDAKNKDNELRSRIDALSVLLKDASEHLNNAYENKKAMETEKESKKDAYPTMVADRNAANDMMNKKYADLKKLRDDFYTADKAFKAYLDESKRIKYEQQRLEREEREKKLAEEAAAREAGIAVESTVSGTLPLDKDLINYSPYAAELTECENMIKYLQNLRPKNTAEERRKQLEAQKEAEQRKEKALANFMQGAKVTVVKKDEDDESWGSLSKNNNKGKKNTTAAAAPVVEEEKERILSFNLPTMEILTKYGVPVPATSADLDVAIAAVEKKKKYYESAPAPVKAAPVTSTTTTSTKTSGVSVGANVKTPYGNAVISSIRTDGFYVCKMTGFEATAYLQKDQLRN